MTGKLLKQNASFRNFFIGQVVSQLGDRIHSLALLWITYKWSGSAALVGGIMIGTSLPGILIAPYAGTVIDKFDKKQVMILADIVRFLILCFITYASYSGFLNYSILVTATVFMSIASSFFNPAALSVMPELVGSDRNMLTGANALSQIGQSASAVAGPIAGSALIAAIGVSAAFLFNTFSFVASVVFLLRIKQKLSRTRTSESWLKDIGKVKEVFAQLPLLRQLLVPVIIVNLFLCAITILIPVLAESIFKMGAVGMGWLMASFGSGMFAGTIILSFFKISLSERVMVAANFILLGVAFAIVGFGGSFPMSVVGFILGGFCLNVVNIKLIVLYQMLLPPESRGKVIAVITALALSSQPVSYGVTGYILDVVNPLTLLMVSGAVIFVIGLYVYFLSGWRECLAESSV